MRRLLALAFAAGLTACTQHDTPTEGPTPPADAPPDAPADVDWGKDINGVGTEPFWAVEIRQGRLKLSGPDREDIITPHDGPETRGDGAVFGGTSASGVALRVTLTAEPCSDGMSDLAYPFVARVETAGEMLNGCAAPLDAWPKQPDASR